MTPSDPLGRRIAAALCVACLAWALWLPLAPWSLAENAAASSAAVWSVPYAVAPLVCHRRPERSFFTRGVQWPVCARCSGLYLSAGAGVLAAVALSSFAVRRPPRGAGWRALILLASAPTVVSWAGERAGWWEGAPHARAWLAVPLGIAIGALLASAARGELQDGPKT